MKVYDYICGMCQLIGSLCEIAFGFAYLGEETILAAQTNV